jgi:hypothetical protein
MRRDRGGGLPLTMLGLSVTQSGPFAAALLSLLSGGPFMR